MRFAKSSVVGLIIVFVAITGTVCCKAQTQSNESAPNKPFPKNTAIEQNNKVNGDNNFIPEDSPQQSYSELHKSPYQAKPRRKQIKYPGDCEAKADYVLETVCRETLENIISKLPKEGCTYEAFQPELHRFREEVKGYLGVLTYTVQESDTDGIEGVAKKLGTLPANIIRNSNLKNPVNLTVGQELKYEKAELKEYVTNWLDENSYIEFYPLSANKYLLEIRCWARFC